MVDLSIMIIGVRVMVFNTTNNISVKLWRSVLLVEETRIPGENHSPGGLIKTKDFKIGASTCCLSANHAAFRGKSK
jgi:hypothetical protein